MEKAEAEFQKRGARELREILSLARPFARARDAHFLNMLNAIAERVAKDGQAVSTSTLKAEHQATGEIKEFEGAVRCLRRLVWQIWNVGWLKELPNWQPRRADGGGRSRPCH